MTKLGDLSNDELLARLRIHFGRGNVWLVGLLAYLGELDARRLYAEQACTSTWDFCVRKLGMSESEAQRRIAVARVLRAFPLARTYLERGHIHLCALYELHKHITQDNHEELLREAAGKTTKEVGAMIARRFPKPDVHPCIEPFGPQPGLPVAAMDPASPSGARMAAPTTGTTGTPVVRPRVEPLSATRYRVALTVSGETKDKLERVRDLMRHRNPSGDLEKIFDLCIDLLLTKLEKERLGKTTRKTAKMRAVAVDDSKSGLRNDRVAAKQNGTTSSLPDDRATAQRDGATSSQPDDRAAAQRHDATTSLPDGRATAQRHEETTSLPDDGTLAQSESNGATSVKASRERTTARRSHVPRAVLREVVARDGEQCTFADADGNRCPGRGFLELDHIDAKALGGSDEAANLRMRCRTHNHLHAEQVFGREYVAQRIHLRRRKSVATQAPVFETAARGLRSLGFREAEVRDVIGRLTTSLEPGASVESIIRNALMLLT